MLPARLTARFLHALGKPEGALAHAHVGRLYRASFLALSVGVLATRATAQQSDLIQGSVRDGSSRAIPGATVLVTRAPDRQVFTAVADSNGQFMIRILEGTHDYLVHISAPGFEAFRKRITTPDSVSSVHVLAVLQIATQTLPIVTVKARPLRPERGGIEPGIGAASAMPDGVSAVLAPDDRLSPDAMALTLAGVLRQADGNAVVFGLASSENRVSLGGMAVNGISVPRDARTQLRVNTSIFDPAVGGFSGGEFALELSPGSTYAFRRAHLSLDSPAQQCCTRTDLDASASTRFNLSIGGEGELIENQYTFNAGIDARRSSRPRVSLGDISANQDLAMGIDRGKTDRLMTALGKVGVPTRMRRSTDVTVEQVAWLGRIDHTPGANKTWGATAFGSCTRSENLGASALSPASYAGASKGCTMGLGYSSEGKLSDRTLVTVRSMFSISAGKQKSYTLLPTGVVDVASDELDAASHVSTVLFGGDAATFGASNGWTVETSAQIEHVPAGNQNHLLKLFGQNLVRYQATMDTENPFGTFAYPTLAALEAGEPSRFEGPLGRGKQAALQWNGAFAVGDIWQVVPRLRVQFGLRFDAYGFPSANKANGSLRRALGIDATRADLGLSLSPRIGFTWRYGYSPYTATGLVGRSYGEFFSPPLGVIRGGFGAFQSSPSVSLLDGSEYRDEAASQLRRVICSGGEVPLPDWRPRSNNSPPSATQCQSTNGVQGAVPNLSIVSGGYRPPVSWRGNLTWLTQTTVGRLTVDAVLSFGSARQEVNDVNRVASPYFTLPWEANRPVYVPAGEIDPASGTPRYGASRRDPSIGAIRVFTSPLHSTAARIGATIVPYVPSKNLFLSFGYSRGKVRTQYAGERFAIFGNAAESEVASGDLDVRDQIIVQAAATVGGISLSAFANIQSGRPFTPFVGGDINADGRSGDRAFVFDPAATSDASLAQGMRSILAHAPAAVRACLLSQIGRPAELNSCRGPWTVFSNARLDVESRLLHLPDRVRVSVNLSNPLAALDAIVHGSGRVVGWGDPRPIDGLLLHVTGFDPGRRVFAYQPNANFGHAASASAIASGARLTVDVSINLGVPIVVQQLERQLMPGRGGRAGARLDAATIARRYGTTVPNIFRVLLSESDSLLLSVNQQRALMEATARYIRQADSVWAELGVYLAAQPDHYDAKESLVHAERATAAVWALARDQRGLIRGVLTPVQLQLSPAFVRRVIDATRPIPFRLYIPSSP